MQITLNGEQRELEVGLSVGALLARLQIRPGRVVVELNRRVISRDALDSTRLQDGDRLEIVHFVGGG